MNNNFLNIKVQNFGSINNSNIDITPLIILTGVNSSGKSFIAKLINLFNSPNNKEIYKNISKYSSNTSKYLSAENKKLFNKICDETTNYFKKNYNKTNNSFKIPIKEFYVLIKDSVFKLFSLMFEEMIQEQYEANLDNLINFKKSFFEINVNENIIYKKQTEKLKFYSKAIELTNIVFSTPLNEKMIIHVDSDDENIELNLEVLSSNPYFDDFDLIFPTFYSTIVNIIVKNMPQKDSYYIPSERSEIIIDKKMLSRRVKNESELSKNQGDVLSNIIKIDTSKKSCFYDLGCDFDKDFSGILVDIEEKELVNDIIYKDFDTDDIIPSKILSTSVHEMTIFSLYLKYVLKKDDILIIEEPEAHLHPKNQRLLVKYIVKAVNKGLNVIITTHSEYISDQINNFVRLNNIPPEKILELKYSEEDVINVDDLSIYNFKKVSANLFDSERIDIDETGFFEENFSKIIDELYQETINITNSSIR